MQLNKEAQELHYIYTLQDKERQERLREYLCNKLPPQDTYPKIGIQAQIEKAFFQALNYLREYRLERNEEGETITELVRACFDVARKHGIATGEISSQLLVRALESSTVDFKAMETQKKRKENTRELILEIALRTFSEKGYHSTTMDTIAKRAGLGKGTLYRYFRNKEKLFSELIEFHLEELEAKINSVFSEEDDVLTIIAKYLKAYFRFFDKNREFYKILIQEHREFGGEVRELYIRRVLRRVPTLKKKIYEATKQGVLKDIDFLTVFYGVMGFVDGVMQKWVARDCSYSLIDEIPTVLETIFYGFVEGKQYHGPILKQEIAENVSHWS